MQTACLVQREERTGARGSAHAQNAESRAAPARRGPGGAAVVPAAAEGSRGDGGRGPRWLGTGWPCPRVCPVKRARAVTRWGVVLCTCALAHAPASLRSTPFLQETTPNKQLFLNYRYFIFILFYFIVKRPLDTRTTLQHLSVRCITAAFLSANRAVRSTSLSPFSRLGVL